MSFDFIKKDGFDTNTSFSFGTENKDEKKEETGFGPKKFIFTPQVENESTKKKDGLKNVTDGLSFGHDKDSKAFSFQNEENKKKENKDKGFSFDQPSTDKKENKTDEKKDEKKDKGFSFGEEKKDEKKDKGFSFGDEENKEEKKDKGFSFGEENKDEKKDKGFSFAGVENKDKGTGSNEEKKDKKDEKKDVFVFGEDKKDEKDKGFSFGVTSGVGTEEKKEGFDKKPDEKKEEKKEEKKDNQLTSNELQEMGNQSVENLILKWNKQLDEDVSDFQKLAEKVSEWDRKIIQYDEKLKKVDQDVRKIEESQKTLDTNLDLISSQQYEIEQLLDQYESKVEKYYQETKFLNPDLEREKIYTMASEVNSQLDGLSKNLKEMIQKLKQQQKNNVESEVNDIINTLNIHLNALQWIDRNSNDLQDLIQNYK